jgi:hypothetical protein
MDVARRMVAAQRSAVQERPLTAASPASAEVSAAAGLRT